MHLRVLHLLLGHKKVEVSIHPVQDLPELNHPLRVLVRINHVRQRFVVILQSIIEDCVPGNRGVLFLDTSVFLHD